MESVKISPDGLSKLGFTKQSHAVVLDNILFDIWRKQWVCVLESRESDMYQFRIIKDIEYIFIKNVSFINEVELLYNIEIDNK
jgi:hypothetical protein